MANPNPSPETRFKPGQSGNPSGKSSEQIAREKRSSDIASQLTHMGLSYIQEKLESGEIDVMDILNADMMRFIKEAQDRAHGTPKQSTEVSGADGAALAMSLTVNTQITDAD